jgi:hypothetical protein
MICTKCKDNNPVDFENQFYHGFVCTKCLEINIEEKNCDHDQRFVLVEKSNKSTELRKVCIKCYEIEQGYKKNKYDLKNIQIRSLEYLNKLRYEKYDTRGEVFELLKERKQYYIDILKTNEDLRYQEYLKSEKWKIKRNLVLQRDNYLCKGCGIVKATQVHHLTYENKYDEFLFQLISLCKPCHEKYHNK